MIYLDHASTAPLRRPVLEAMWPYLTSEFGNPSSVHEVGRRARDALEDSRARVAQVLGCRPAEVIFTSGGTESTNAAIKGVAWARPAGRHIVTTAIEHQAVLAAGRPLMLYDNFELVEVPVDRTGCAETGAIMAPVRPDTTLVSVMAANNEVGTILPARDVGPQCRQIGIPFLIDAVQAAGHLPLRPLVEGSDFLSLSAHKIGGPRGVGALYIRSGTTMAALLNGGGQERGLRSGTENVAGAVGFATALELAESEREAETVRLGALRDRLIAGILGSIEGAALTGHPEKRLAHHASFVFAGVGGETLLVDLDMAEIACSSGSACHAGSTEPSHVMLALGFDAAMAGTAVRFTLGPSTTSEDIETVLDVLPGIVDAVRR